MDSQERFVLLMILLATGANGWGLFFVGLLTRSRRLADAQVRLSVPMNTAIGCALFMVVGGFFVAGDGAYFPFLFGWQIIGTCVTIADVLFDRAARLRRRIVRIKTLPAVLAGLFLAFMALGPALSGAWNPNDDAPAYSYLGQRLLATGGLIDPFNTRRLNSYGAAEMYQALTIKIVNQLAGIGIEWFFFLLLTVALFVRSLDRRFAAIALITIGLGIEVMHPVGAWANVAPTFSGTALTLALARLLSEHDTENPTWIFVLAGVLFAALFALRIEFLLPALCVMLVASFHRRRPTAGVGYLALSGIVTVVSLTGWAIALERSSGTPVFPLFASYWTQTSWFVNPAIHTFSQYVSNFDAVAGIDHWDIGLLGSLAIAIGGYTITKRIIRTRRRSSADLFLVEFRMDVIVALALGCAGLLAYEAYSLPGGALGDIMRYAAPSLLVLVLFTLDRIWTLALELWQLHDNDERKGSTTTRRLFALTLSLGGVAFFGLFLGNHPTIYQRYFSKNLHQAVAAASGEPVLEDEYNAKFLRSQQRYYTKINRHIPKGAHLLAAVEVPGLLDMSKFNFTTIDEPGGTSPPPHISYNGGPNQLVSYLRRQGIDGIVANTAGSYGLYNLDISKEQLASPVPTYRVTAQFIVKWDRLLVEVEHRYLTVRVGPLRYISFDRPR